MIQSETHYGHEGYTVFENLRAKKRWFIFRDEFGFGEGIKKDSMVIQVLRPMSKYEVIDGAKTTVYDFDKWHFAKRYKSPKGPVGVLERVTWPPSLSREIAQAMINMCGKEAEVKLDTSRDLKDCGI